MATLEQIERSLRAADAAGDTEAATILAGEYKRLQTPAAPESSVPHFEISGTSTSEDKPPEPAKALHKTLGESAVEGLKKGGTALLTGAAKHVGAPLLSVGDLLNDWRTGQPGGTSNTARIKAIDDFTRDQGGDPDSLGYRLLQAPAEILATGGPLAAGSRKVATMLPEALGRLKPLVSDVGVNVGYEGGKAALRTGGDVGETTEAAANAAGGTVLGRSVAKFLGGARTAASEGLRNLTDRGYLPTLGEMGGKAGQIYEDVSRKLFGFGGAIERSRKHAGETYSRAEANRAVEGVGARTDLTGDKAVDAAEQATKSAFRAVKPHIELPGWDAVQSLNKSGREITQNVTALERPELARLERLVRQQIVNRTRTKRTLDGEDIKAIDKVLGKEARKYEKGLTSTDEDMGDAVRIIQKNFREKIKPTANAPAGVLDDLDAANKAHYNVLALRDAAKRVPQATGHFTPSGFAKAADRFGAPRGAGNEAIRELAPNVDPGNSTLRGAAAGAAGYYGGPALVAGLASGSPGVTVAALGGLSAFALHQLANTVPGRHMLYNGLSGLVPGRVLDRISGLPPGQAAAAFRELLARPEVANVLGQVGRQVNQGDENAP